MGLLNGTKNTLKSKSNQIINIKLTTKTKKIAPHKILKANKSTRKCRFKKKQI